MSVITLEGIVEQGQIRLTTNLHLPDNTKVFVVVPDVEIQQSAHVLTPRLLHRKQVADFEMEVIEDAPDAGV
jgi:hypothetical protein